MISNKLETLENSLGLHSSRYEKVLIPADFKVGVNKQHMQQSFCETYNSKSLIKQLTFNKNPNRPTYINLILTNVLCSFQSICIIETLLLDFHLMNLTAMRKSFNKIRPRIVNIGVSSNSPMKHLEKL